MELRIIPVREMHLLAKKIDHHISDVMTSAVIFFSWIPETDNTLHREKIYKSVGKSTSSYESISYQKTAIHLFINFDL